MIYIYDILLNFHKTIYEYYEWNKEDKIIHIKRIKLFKISTEQFQELYQYNIKIDKDFQELLYNKTELYRQIPIEYAALFTDGYRVLALHFDKEGKTIERSRLVLEEEEEILAISRKVELYQIGYKKKNYIKKEMLTRKEKSIKNSLMLYINKLYKDKNVAALKYLYLDYYEKSEDDIEKIYKNLIASLEEISNKHLHLLQILNLSSKNKSTT